MSWLADALHLCIRGSHFPPGASKWNKIEIEHRLFSHLTESGRGKPLRTFETVVETIGHARTTSGLRVRARPDTKTYPTGVVVNPTEMQGLSLHPHDFHGEWNYQLRPRRT